MMTKRRRRRRMVQRSIEVQSQVLVLTFDATEEIHTKIHTEIHLEDIHKHNTTLSPCTASSA
jgi:hypothetical protein